MMVCCHSNCCLLVSMVYSMEPLLLFWSMMVCCHSNCCLLVSMVYSPSHSEMLGVPTPWGKGIAMVTSFNSKARFSSSNSMLTSHPPWPLSDGQQLIERGIADSLVVWSLHFRTPTPVFKGKGLAGFFNPMTLLVLKRSLSIFGCVWSCMALFSVFCSSNLTLPTFSS